MATALGKRKRRVEATEEHTSESDSDEKGVRARFQRAFEAKFKPLSKKEVPAKTLADNANESDGSKCESDWTGLSDETEEEVEIIDHEPAREFDDVAQRNEFKTFMSSRPPSWIDDVFDAQTPRQKATPAPVDAAETANLRDDLALQRLLKESHLLDPAAMQGSSSTGPEGKGRIKALDLRLRELGAKRAVGDQVKMPMAHRKGIVAKATSREKRRRQEAAENGIILERVKVGGEAEPRRARGVGAPGVGKFHGGTLKLSSRDVRSIEGPKKVGSDGRGKGRRR